MRKLLSFLLLMALPVVCFASIELREEGTRLGSTEYVDVVGGSATATIASGLGTLTIATNPPVEYVTAATKVLAASDDGKTLVFTSASNTYVTLPQAANITEGINCINGDGAKTLTVVPYSGDSLEVGVTNMPADDRLAASGDTGESATARGSGTSVYLTVTGTWIDAN